MTFLGLLVAFLREVISSFKVESAPMSLSPPAYLLQIPLPGSQQLPQVLPITGDIRLGRGSTNDLVLDDPFVSNIHARIYFDREEYWLEDLGSTNRTYVNGELVNGPRMLKQVALITIGNAVVVFHTSPNSPVGKG